MDAAGASWARLPAARQAAAARRYGAVLRLARIAAGLTLAEAGRRVGYSAATLSRMETGRRPLTDVTVLRRLSDVFGIPPAMFGLAHADATAGAAASGAVRSVAAPAATDPAKVRQEAAKDGDDPVRRRELLSGLATAAVLPWTAPVVEDVSPVAALDRLVTAGVGQAVRPVPLGQLATLLNAAQQGFRQCRYRQLAANLPALIAAASASRDQATGHIRRRLDGLLAGSYRLASEVCVKLNDDAIAWVLADRALAAARQAGNPVGVAESARCVAVAMRRGGHHDGAIDLLTSTAHTISPQDARPPSGAVLAARGAMLCTAAYSAAQHGKAGMAVDLIGEAADAAARLPAGLPADRNPFGRTNVGIYKIAIYTVIGETGTALTQAERISVHHLATPERRGRYLIDTARAWLRHGAYDRACQAVLAAEHHAPQDLLRPSVRGLVGQLLYAPAPTPVGLRDLAARIGATHR